MQTARLDTTQQVPADGESLTSFSAQLRAFLHEIRKATGVPGIGAGVSFEGQRIFACAGVQSLRTAAALTEDTRFHLGCITKWLLAAVVLERVHEGTLDLHAPLGEYLPELKRTRIGRSVHLVHLLSHTSGYQGTNPLEPRTRSWRWDDLADYLRAVPQFFTPGSVFNYEHSEAVILAKILERVTSRSSTEAIRRGIFEPLGLQAATEDLTGNARGFAGHHVLDPQKSRYRCVSAAPFSVSWRAAFSAAGISLRELLRLSEAAMGPPSPSAGAGPVSDWVRHRLHATAVQIPRGIGGPAAEMLPVAFGLGAAVLGGGFFGNTGVAEGQCVGMRYDGTATSSVVVGINARLPHLRDFVLRAICARLTGRDSAHGRARPFGFDLAELAGVYRGAGDARVFAAVEGPRLICSITPRSRADGLRAELRIDDAGRPALHCALPQLSLGFFRRQEGDIGLMLGLNAYKRLGPDEREGERLR